MARVSNCAGSNNTLEHVELSSDTDQLDPEKEKLLWESGKKFN